MKRALPYAYIAKAVYKSDLVCGVSGSWEIEPDTIVRKFGFLCAKYKRGSETILAFAGTDPKSAIDWLSDLQNLLLLSGQEGQAWTEIFHVNPREQKSLVITGHSLGGNLAILASIASGRPCYTFNTEGLGAFAALVAYLDKWLHKVSTAEIFNFVTAADRLVALTRILPLPGKKVWIPDDLGFFHPIKGHFMEHVIARMQALTGMV